MNDVTTSAFSLGTTTSKENGHARASPVQVNVQDAVSE